MMTLEQCAAELIDRNLSEVSRGSKISRPTLYKVLKGSEDINYSVYKALAEYLSKN